MVLVPTSAQASAPPRPRGRDGPQGRPTDRHPAPARPQQPRHHLADLPPRRRQRRDHRHRPFPAGADDSGEHLTSALNVAQRRLSHIARALVLELRPAGASRPPTSCLGTAFLPSSRGALLLLVPCERLALTHADSRLPANDAYEPSGDRPTARGSVLEDGTGDPFPVGPINAVAGSLSGSSLAPGISSASALPCSIGNIGSAVPWMTKVDAVIEDSVPLENSPSGSTSWFCTAAKSRARLTSRRTRRRVGSSSNGRRSPASTREYSTR